MGSVSYFPFIPDKTGSNIGKWDDPEQTVTHDDHEEDNEDSNDITDRRDDTTHTTETDLHQLLVYRVSS